MTTLTIDLNDPADVDGGIKILEQRRTTLRVPGSVDEGNDDVDVADRTVEKLYGRLGSNLRTVLDTVASKPEGSVHSIESLAKELRIKYTSLRSKMNAPLRKSWLKVAEEIPNAPELFQWEWRGDRFYFSMTPEVRAAILKRRQT